jgi:hypothetical protein
VAEHVTELGSTKYAQLEGRQVSWINELAAGLKGSDLAAGARILQELSNRLDTNPPRGPKG